MSAESTTTERPTYILTRAEVRAVSRVSPSFVRVTLGGEELSELGTPGEVYDSRVKLVFPPASGVLAEIDRSTHDWWGSYLAVPEEERGSMRTYSVRELRVADDGRTEVDIDFVLHLEPGLTGPASRWASTAAAGQELWLVGPRRGVVAHGGAEYAPGSATSVVLVGDETAAPAIARILEDAPRDLRGTAFIEVPSPADVLAIDVPAGVDVHWLPRDAGEPHGFRPRCSSTWATTMPGTRSASPTSRGRTSSGRPPSTRAWGRRSRPTTRPAATSGSRARAVS